jgi:hypothetical protein
MARQGNEEQDNEEQDNEEQDNEVEDNIIIWLINKNIVIYVSILSVCPIQIFLIHIMYNCFLYSGYSMKVFNIKWCFI